MNRSDALIVEYPKRKSEKVNAVVEVDESDFFDEPLGLEIYNDQSCND